MKPCQLDWQKLVILEKIYSVEEKTSYFTDLKMHFTINLAFVNYFNDMIEELGIPISQNWTTQEQILPLSLETFEINPNLITAPETL